MVGLDKIWKGRDISTGTRPMLVRALVIKVATYGCESWTTKKGSGRKMRLFKSRCLNAEKRVDGNKKNKLDKLVIILKEVCNWKWSNEAQADIFGHVMRKKLLCWQWATLRGIEADLEPDGWTKSRKQQAYLYKHWQSWQKKGTSVGRQSSWWSPEVVYDRTGQGVTRWPVAYCNCSVLLITSY